MLSRSLRITPRLFTPFKPMNMSSSSKCIEIESRDQFFKEINSRKGASIVKFSATYFIQTPHIWFTYSWCQPCKMVHQKLIDIVDHYDKSKILLFNVDIDKNLEIAEEFQVILISNEIDYFFSLIFTTYFNIKLYHLMIIILLLNLIVWFVMYFLNVIR